MDYNKLALELHEKNRGKITTKLRDQSELDRDKLSSYYSPGVGAVSKAISENPDDLAKYTWTNNLVAVISDGSAILGLGDLGPKAAMPVMEGKSLLFKHFADIDSIPIVLDVHSEEEIIKTIKAIAPSFGAINLEDIAAPKCFSIEERLKDELGIPVFHDDQHGTAVVVLAGLINSLKITNRDIKTSKIVIAGAGAAGVAIAKLLDKYSNQNGGETSIVAVDRHGIISQEREDLDESKQTLLKFTNKENASGSLVDALKGADIFIGVSGPDTITPEMIKTMAPDPIIFALANPIPEIMPDVAKQAGAAIVATGRSDFANQVNNAVAFPGIFRGALDNGVQKITDDHKIAAAKAIAGLVENPTVEEIIPSVLNKNLVPEIAKVIK